VQTGKVASGQVVATGGCIYARDVPTLPGQLTEADLAWKGSTPAWTDTEIDDVIAFLQTLSDRDVVRALKDPY
jgi:hypothetical protein